LTEALEQQTATSEILRVISSSPTDIQPVLDAVAERAARLCEAYDAVIFRCDGDVLRRVAHQGEIPAVITLPLVRGTAGGRSVIERRTIAIDDIRAAADEYPEGGEAARPLGHRSVLSVPLLREGEAIGVISVRRTEVQPFTPKQITLLETFAAQAVIAIENVRLFSELRERTAELTRSVAQLTALGEVSRAVSSTLDVETVLQTIVMRANQLAGTAGCAIWEYDELRAEFRLRASHYADARDAAILPAPGGVTTIPKGQGLTTRVVELRQPVQIPDITVEGAYESPVRSALIDAGHRALLGVPLLSEVEAGRLELELARFHVPTALDNALTLVRERATRHGIMVTLTVNPGVGDIVADERKVKQILLNLLSNAVKFTPEGGRVGLTATAADAMITIAVSDTGIGIAPEDQAAIFEEFQQVGHDDARKQEGTGLGLTLAKKFVELHGGRIWVQSQMGQGSTFACPFDPKPGVRATRKEALLH
jgi:signal transduction histidine kinase